MKMEKMRYLFVLLTVGVAILCFFPLVLTFIIRDKIDCFPFVRDMVRLSMPNPEESAMLPQSKTQDPATLLQSRPQDPATLPQFKPEEPAMLPPSAPQDPAMPFQSKHQDPATLLHSAPQDPAMPFQSASQDPATLSQPKPEKLAVLPPSASQDLARLPQPAPQDPAKYPQSTSQNLATPSVPRAPSLNNTARFLKPQSKFLGQPIQGYDNNLLMKPADPHVIIYNRVPKCASATMLRICLSLSKSNSFSFNNMRDLGKHSSRADKVKLAKWIFGRSFTSRHFFFEHMTYLNFSRVGFWEPTWINVVRHPVKRYISHYYFKGPNQTLDVCIGTGRCYFKHGKYRIPSQISYFIGYNPISKLKLNARALQMAKHVVEKVFVVIGIQEELDNTLLVFEHLLPNFFGGATKIEYKNWNIQASKPPTSNKTLAILQRLLKVDIEFYDYLKQRFHRQLEGVREQLRNNHL
ncbi:heparan sulfate 2-O-sulfotransferase pipe-like [Penaeus monodon]|uniref:heparan sulfate 2-O-sulfotransferase pipe-like n=1 Tax=Penaeus monodon TaxID=6687 RepID=UPI0018A71AEE|nr:heparan sulfate 2-O-sulfotransferase pipe-like [Penaeus monodon]XP_037790497.1 heparan sulfate 2-O-sulfotransferase pipe-like [Penaeus monodon]